MIVDVPTPADFYAAGVNQLFLAWQIAMASLEEYDQALDYGAEDDSETRAEYWRRAQPALANAYSLIQQGMEMALKGRIASVSPLLLIGDPADWPGRAATQDVSFGEFRTLDAADLVKVHNSIAAPPLDNRFKTFWEEVRRERNRIMHSVAAKAFEPVELVRAILTAAAALFGDMRWPARLIEMEADGRLAALGYDDNVQNNVMRQVNAALEHLTPAEAKRFLAYDKDRRGYICPHCYAAASKDWQETWPHLAQLQTKAPGAIDLSCIVCETDTQITRQRCENPECQGDVIDEDLCLTCGRRQNEVFEVDSGLADASLDAAAHSYDFVFGRGTAGSGGYFASDRQLLADDERAKKHGEFALGEPHLQEWTTVTIRQVLRPAFPDLTDRDRVLGHWRRTDDGLEWVAGVAVDFPDLSLAQPLL